MALFEINLPYFEPAVQAGFPSPANDFTETPLNLHSYLVKHPAATFFVRASGDSMVGAGIYSGDLLVVDRSLQPEDRKVILAVVNGELMVKRFRLWKQKHWLVSENKNYPPLEITEAMGFSTWGVVTHVIHAL